MKLISKSNQWNLYMYADSRCTIYVYDRFFYGEIEFIRISKATRKGKCKSDRITINRDKFKGIISELEFRGLVII